MASPAKKEVQPTETKAYTITPGALPTLLGLLLSTVTPTGKPKPMAVPIVWGPPGTGKTEIIGQLAKKWRLRGVALHLAQYDPSHIKGIPVRLADGTVKWFPSSYLPGQHTVRRLKADKHEIDFNFPYAERVITRIFTQDGREVARFNDAMRNPEIEEGAANWNEINAKVTVDDPRSKVIVDLSGSPADFYRVVIEEAALLFLDELSAASKVTQKAALSLLNDRRVGEYDVPELCPMLCAGNHEAHGAYIEPMSFPVANRLCHINLIPDLQSFLVYYDTLDLDPTVSGFLKMKGDVDYLFKFDKAVMKEGKLGAPTSRSWVRMAEQIDGMPNEFAQLTIVGYIGAHVGGEYIAYREMYANLPDADAILRGTVTKVDFKKIGDQYNIPVLGVQHGLSLALAGAVRRFYKAHYQEGVAADKQSDEWKTAVDSFCTFAKAHFKDEINMMTTGVIFQGYGVPATAFRSDAFREWADKYLKFLRRIKGFQS